MLRKSAQETVVFGASRLAVAADQALLSGKSYLSGLSDNSEVLGQGAE